MISIEEYSLLPDWKTVRRICKAISVLDAILCREWEYRYYSYNSTWADDEEFFEMRNGSGDQMLVLFHRDGCVINGFAPEFKQPDKEQITSNLPIIFDEFIFGEPVNTTGTTFCLWATEQANWQVRLVEDYNDNLVEILSIFDGHPQTYIDWATGYFSESHKENGIPLDAVTSIYQGQTLTKAMVLSIVDEFSDWQQFETDLDEIGYPYNFT